ncbi:hypothetical protein B0I35DRAFT_444706 [Stachybotrys elegans]|uniref:Autophagy-related protein n=1 Tax=Stachybotrys elegans TaxID=80388 RepID=A0A8K0SJT1_9HYPO|nr:hypothetical protein B0I35DRAFT_444706 [Stachybotrys elegans]
MTLCLAPLIAHIVAGVASPVYLHTKQPSWHDRVCHYNPTSIMWRYFAIIDRRIRAKTWNAADMAASNANFWTTKGWDGSEEMMDLSRSSCTKLPYRPRVSFLSGSAANTIITTLQGVQAVYALVIGLVNDDYSYTTSLATLFFPLSVLGLLRLPAAIYLSSDYSYIDGGALLADFTYDLPADLPSNQLLEPPPEVCIYGRPLYAMGLLEPPSTSASERFHPVNSWRGIIVRIGFLLVVLGITGLSLVYLLPRWALTEYTTSNLLSSIFYSIIMAVTSTVFGVYFCQVVSSGTTIIPCINSIWYKVYTFSLFALAGVLIIIMGLETRTTPCGKFTTYPKSIDEIICPSLQL